MRGGSICARFGKTEVQDFAFLDEVLDRARDILDRHGRINAMLVVEIDTIGAQALEGLFDDTLDTLRAAVQCDGPVNRKTKLRGDRDLVANTLQGFAHKLFVRVRAIHFGGVKKGHTVLVGRADCFQALLFGRGGSVIRADAHASRAQFGYLQCAEFPLFHLLVSFDLYGAGLLRPGRYRSPRGADCDCCAKQSGGFQKLAPSKTIAGPNILGFIYVSIAVFIWHELRLVV